MFVVGTAGHVDHGKSTLVEALTGIDPDRLKEEKEREMTIDLGFAWLKLGDHQDEIGIVDVPGHRDFIENMLAGVGGIDLALFVIAADEGVMPQTREHLAILDLLEVKGGVVALTKIDLIDDPDWLDLVTLDVAEALQRTVLADAPIVPVSARTGAGLPELRAAILDSLGHTEPRPDFGRARLPVDRIFSLAGFGTIVTGTLIDGSLRVGDAVEILPGGRRGRIRGLQTHRTKLEVARPGSRVAVNLTGIAKEAITRGNVVSVPGILRDTTLCDVNYRHLADADVPLTHNMAVKMFVGAAEVMARVRLIGQRQIEPGGRGWLQLAVKEPIAVARADRFILRRPSPGATLGGGRILDPFPGRRHRRFKPEVIQRFETSAHGSPGEKLIQAAGQLQPATQVAIIKQAGLASEAAEPAWQELLRDKELIAVGQYFLTAAGWQRLLRDLEDILDSFHRQYPLRPGLAREELRSRLGLPATVFNPLLNQAAESGLAVEDGAIVHRPDHNIRLSPAQEESVSRLMRRFELAGVNSPSVKEARAEIGDDLYYALVDLGRLQPISEDVVYRTEDYLAFTATIKAFLQQHGQINAAELRDLLSTSRKYAIALLEHLDENRITRRVGDSRVLS
jgi:selenocysteine-specific elongation factor